MAATKPPIEPFKPSELSAPDLVTLPVGEESIRAAPLVGKSRTYMGLASDRKPRDQDMAADERIPIGATFIENDTGRTYRWDGFSWKDVQPENEQVVVLQLVLLELSKITKLLQLAVN